MKDWNLKPVWAAEQRIYAEFQRICKEHGLRQYASSGTVLGAIRHKGFIPWDDDFDVMMPRKDFERFIEIVEAELPLWLKFVSYRNCRAYKNMFPKIIISDVAMVEKICEESGLPAPEGVFIDIFPIDGYPVSWLGKRLRYAYVSMCRLLITISGLNIFNRVMEFLAALVPFDSAKLATDWGGWRKREERFMRREVSRWMSAADFGDGIEVPFMNGKVRVPSNWERYLEWWYGDWRKLPPERDRHPDHLTAAQSKKAYRLG